MNAWKIQVFLPIFFCLVIAPQAYSSVFDVNNSGVVEPAISLLLSLCLSMLLISRKDTTYYLTPFELACIAFILFNIAKVFAGNTFSAAYWLLVAVLYFLFKKINSLVSARVYSRILISIVSINLLSFTAFAAWQHFFTPKTIDLFYFPNKSIFGIVLASQLSFIIPLYFSKKTKEGLPKMMKLGILCIITGAATLLIFTNGRAAWFGLGAAIFYMLIQTKKWEIKKISIIAVPGLIIFLSVLYFYKSGSSAGRTLIYKISAVMLRENWLFGIGNGQFRVRYNEYQAAYFSTHDINSKEALLADNSFYSFNDLFQFTIENGVIGDLLVLAIMFLLFRQIKGARIRSQNKQLVLASSTSLICVLAGSLFSYPLQIFPIQLQVTLCLSIINTFTSDPKQQIILPQIWIRSSKIIPNLISGLLVVHFYYYYKFRRKCVAAHELKRAGFKQLALKKYRELNDSYIKDGNVSYRYAQELYYNSQLLKAKEVLTKAKRYYCSNDVYKLSAAIEEELGSYKQAEKEYKTAVYMVPNRMISRKNLIDFYIKIKDTAKAIYWANSIVNMPVKIPSKITVNIQKTVKRILIDIKK